MHEFLLKICDNRDRDNINELRYKQEIEEVIKGHWGLKLYQKLPKLATPQQFHPQGIRERLLVVLFDRNTKKLTICKHGI